MKKIYLVWGFTGEYDDRKDWTVKAFANKEMAEQLAKRLNKWCNSHSCGEIIDKWKFEQRERHLQKENLSLRLTPPEDPVCFSFGDGGVKYEVYDLDFEDDMTIEEASKNLYKELKVYPWLIGIGTSSKEIMVYVKNKNDLSLDLINNGYEGFPILVKKMKGKVKPA